MLFNPGYSDPWCIRELGNIFTPITLNLAIKTQPKSVTNKFNLQDRYYITFS